MHDGDVTNSPGLVPVLTAGVDQLERVLSFDDERLGDHVLVGLALRPPSC